jgi:hypothetical protein
MLMNRSPRSPFGLFAALGEEDAEVGARWGSVLLIAALALALSVRLYLALSTSFPINDGALFYEFVRGVAGSFPGLPETVRYNGLDVPFAYPPLSFWVAAALVRAGLDPLGIVHLLPIVMNAVYVLLFAALLLKNGHSRLFTALALLFMFTTLRSFEWLVMGGGLSRGLGSVFLLLTLLAAGLPGHEREAAGLPLSRLVLAGICIAGAILSHLEWGVLAAASFVASRALSARGFARFAWDNVVAGAAALLCIVPWLLFVLATHGVEPFLSAGGTSNWSLLNSLLHVPALLFNNRANLFFLLGLVVVLARRDLFWPIFLLLCLFLTPRHSATPVVLGIAAISVHGALAFWALLRRTRLTAPQAAAAMALLLALVLVWQVYRDTRSAGPFRPLPATTIEAMKWVRSNTPGAAYAVVTEHGWYYDAAAEWFPTLTGARSITTVQGREWLPDNAFGRWLAMDVELKGAATCRNVLTTLRGYGRADYIWAQTRQECFRAPPFRAVHRRGDIIIFQVLRPT